MAPFLTFSPGFVKRSLTSPCPARYFLLMPRSIMLVTRGHIDLLRVTSAACPGH